MHDLSPPTRQCGIVLHIITLGFMYLKRELFKMMYYMMKIKLMKSLTAL